MRPGADIGFLARAAGRIASIAEHAGDLRPRFRPPGEVLSFGHEFLTQAEANALLTPGNRRSCFSTASSSRSGHADAQDRQPRRHRDRPTACSPGARHHLQFEAAEMKPARPFSCASAQSLEAPLTIYLSGTVPSCAYAILPPSPKRDVDPSIRMTDAEDFGRADATSLSCSADDPSPRLPADRGAMAGNGAAMARAFKVFPTPVGFYEADVAAPSRMATLAAWGVHDLFASGHASSLATPSGAPGAGAPGRDRACPDGHARRDCGGCGPLGPSRPDEGDGEGGRGAPTPSQDRPPADRWALTARSGPVRDGAARPRAVGRPGVGARRLGRPAKPRLGRRPSAISRRLRAPRGGAGRRDQTRGG